MAITSFFKVNKNKFETRDSGKVFFEICTHLSHLKASLVSYVSVVRVSTKLVSVDFANEKLIVDFTSVLQIMG